jgi:anaerobic selenocysteine-containing dehydrogenase
VQQAVAALHTRGRGRALRHGADTIRSLARQLADAPTRRRVRPHWHLHPAYGTLASWLVDVLNTLTGNLDREGGMLFAKSAAFATNTAGKPGRARA